MKLTQPLKGEVIEVHPGIHPGFIQIVVRYFSDEVPLEPLDDNVLEDGKTPARCKHDRAIDVPAPLPTGQALADVISAGGHGIIMQIEAEDVAPVAPVDKSHSVAAARALIGKHFHVARPAAPARPDESSASTNLIWRKKNAEDEGIGVLKI